jgi:DNA adenine methylase
MTAILRWPGAKWSTADWIVDHLPQHYHYLEPYFGSGGVFFTKPPSRHEVLNDLDGNVCNVFRIIREQPDELATLLTFTPYSRAEYDATYSTRGRFVPTGNPLEDARRFLVRAWMAQGGRIGNNSGWAHAGLSDNNMPDRWRRLPCLVHIVAARLRAAEIENRPALEVINRMRDPDVLIYADPPYVSSTRSDARHGRKTYQHEMTNADHIALMETLDAHPGPVLLSGYHSDLYDSRLAGWHTAEKRVSAEKGNTRTEVLWLNEKAAGTRQLRLL